MRFLVINNDYHVFFGKENPQLKAFDELQAKYTKDDNVFIVIQPQDKNVFTKNTLNALEELVKEAWKVPFATRVDAMTNFQHIAAEEDQLYVADLASNISGKNDQDIQRIKEIALQEPLLVNRLVDPDGKMTAVNISVTLPGKALTENAEVMTFTRNMVEKWSQKYPGFEVFMTGNVMFTGAFDENFEADMMTLTPLMFLIIITFLVVSTRSIGATVSTLIILFSSVITAFGIAGWLGIQLTGPVFSVPNMILTLAVADSVHLFVSILQLLKKGRSKSVAIAEAMKINFTAVVATSVTTAIGFLSMNFSDTPPFRDLGNIAAIGVTAALFYSVILLPALASVFPLKVKQRAERQYMTVFFEKFSEFIIRYKTKLFWASSLIIVAVSVFSFKNELNNDFIKFFDPSVKFRHDTDFINDNLTGMYTIEFSLGAGETDGISDPAYLKKLEEFETWFKAQPHVTHVNSFAGVMRRINRALHGDSLQYYRIPETRMAAAQNLLLYEMSLPYGLDLNNQINVDKSETRFTATVKNISSKELIDMTTRAEEWLQQNAQESMFAHGIGMALMFSHITKRNMASMLYGGLLSLAIISLILVFVFRSFKYGLVSLIPNFAPIAVAFGIWGIIDGQINMGISIVFGMTFGLVVDDTIHMVSKYIFARRTLNYDPEDAIRYSFVTVGHAVLVTTLVLVAGFMVLAQSHFGFNSGMAKLTALTIFLALIFDLIMTPVLLLMFDKKKKSRKTLSEEHKLIKTAAVPSLD